MSKPITVSQLNRYIRDVVDSDSILNNIFVVGEISNFINYYKSGHIYFTLKDGTTQIKAVMFSSYAQRLKFAPQDGMSVICRGRVSVYEKDGIYQLYVEDMQPEGIGSLSIAFEQLKEKLLKEGLFDEVYKKPLPKFPKKIGVATSNMGAAVEDIKNILNRRYPLAEVVIVPTVVQGEQAGDDIVKSLKILDNMPDIDLIIVGRGGGSVEDLWAFNLEKVARAVFDCKKPVISAVGHETDYTICDFVADLRAPTPSAAAELCVPDSNRLLEYLNSVKSMLCVYLNKRLENEYQRFDLLTGSSPLSKPHQLFEPSALKLVALSDALQSAYSSAVKDKANSFYGCVAKLDALSPLAVIGRGYAICENGNGIVKSAKNININDKITVKLNDGKINCTVNEVNYE